MAVYFIEGAGYIKIGHTTSNTAAAVRHRRSGLQTASPVPLTVLAWVIGNAELESWLHRELAEWHVRGEWFRNEGGVAKLLERLQAEPDVMAGIELKTVQWRTTARRVPLQPYDTHSEVIKDPPTIDKAYAKIDPKRAEALRTLSAKLAKGNFRAKK